MRPHHHHQQYDQQYDAPGFPPPPPGVPPFAGPAFGAVPGGFGPGGPNPSGFGGRRGRGPGGRRGRGFGPGFGPGGPGGPGGRRGNVRAAVLALLAEEPRHGYAIMNELGERSGGLWRPSPGSVYPVLSQLEDEGLVTVEKIAGRRVFSLTPVGREYVQTHAEELSEPWQVADSGPRERVQSVMFALQTLGAAAEQVARLGDDAQAAAAVAALESARRSLYRILADEVPAAEGGTPSDQA